MAKIIIFFAFALMAAVVSAAPADKIYVEVEEVPEVQDVTFFEPSPRVTCDLLSWLPINHSLCAAHCIARGFRGGACGSEGICRCRN